MTIKQFIIVSIAILLVGILWIVGNMPLISSEPVSPTRASMHNISTVLEVYQLDHGRFPVSLDVLKPIGGEPFSKPYLKPTEHLVDAWGTRLQYLNFTNQYELRSAGADKVFMTKDDIITGKGTPNQ